MYIISNYSLVFNWQRAVAVLVVVSFYIVVTCRSSTCIVKRKNWTSIVQGMYTLDNQRPVFLFYYAGLGLEGSNYVEGDYDEMATALPVED